MIKSEIKAILEKPTWVLWLAATLFYVLGLFLFCHFVWDETLYQVNYKAETGFENYIEMVRRIDFVRYLLSPLYIFLISFAITGILKIGLPGNKIELENKLLFKIVLIGTFILSIPLWVKVVWFVLIQGSYNMEEVKFFYPFSILYFFDPYDINLTMVKALGKLNLYHLAFMLFITFSVKNVTGHSFIRLFSIVIYTYGLGFLMLQIIPILIFT